MASLPASGAVEGTVWEQPIATGSWTDADGVVWHRRGEPLTGSRVRQLMQRADVRVVLCCPGEAADVGPAERGALWERMEPYVRGRLRARGDHTDFVAGEFRDAERRRLMLIEEYC